MDWLNRFGARKAHTDAQMELSVAIRRGDPGLVRRALELGADPDPGRYTAETTMAPLQIASSTGARDEICHLLLMAGARPSPVGPWGETPLQSAVRVGCSRTVEVLLEARAEPDISDINGNAPLRFAVQAGREDLVRRLVRAGAKVDALNHMGRTCLHDAARIGDDVMIRLMVAFGASVISRDRSGGTPLHALSSIVCMARPGAVPRPPVPITTVAMLAERGALRARDKAGNEALHIAAMSANPEMCRALLDLGACADSTNLDGRRPFDVSRGPARLLLGRYDEARRNGLV